MCLSAAISVDVHALWSLLDYFSRAYVWGIIIATLWAACAGVRLEVRLRSNAGSGANVRPRSLQRHVDAVFMLALLLAAACFANQVLIIDQVYMVLRFTDADVAEPIRIVRFLTTLNSVFIIAFQLIRWRISARLADIPDSTPRVL